MAKSVVWRNRIVESGILPAADFLANPGNWRIHPKPQQEALAGALNEIGWIQEVIVNRTTGNMIDGHLRVTLALREGDDTPVPVKYVELTEAEEKLALATLDPIAAMAAADAAKLDELMQDINTGEAGLQAMLAGLAAENGLYQDENNAGADTEPQIDKAEELRVKWGVEPGQLWQLGEHRLICGDCTDAATVARVMGGERAALAPVDPPYNVGIEYGEAVDDNKRDEDYKDFSIAWFELCKSVSDRQAITPGYYNLALWSYVFGKPYHIGTWTKTNSMTRGHVSRFACYEPILFFGNGWKRDRHNDIFDYAIGQQKNVANHPCPKPLKMWEDLISNYSETGNIIFESFSGSGTTIIACENLNRRCRAIEIDPGYVAVAIERWAAHTGKTPVLISGVEHNKNGD